MTLVKGDSAPNHERRGLKPAPALAYTVATMTAREAFLIVFTFAIPAFVLGATKHGDFQTGKLIEVSADERLDDGTSLRWAIFRVQVADLVYTARGGRVRIRSGDMAQGLIVGDPVQVAIDGDALILIKPNGKELRMRITKRSRVQ